MMRYALYLLIVIGTTACTSERSDQQTEEAIEETMEETLIDTTDRTKIDGVHEFRDDDGNVIMRGQVVGGKREGGWGSYFPDGSIRSQGTFINGLQEGATTVYYENGSIRYTGWYRHGIPVGEWKFYAEDGTPIKLVKYSDDGIKLEEKDL